MCDEYNDGGFTEEITGHAEESDDDEDDLNESINVSAQLLAAKNESEHLKEKADQTETETIQKEPDTERNAAKESDDESSGETNEVESFSANNNNDVIVECNKSIKKVNSIKNEFIQTIKLTNTVLEFEKGLEKDSPSQSKSGFYSSGNFNGIKKLVPLKYFHLELIEIDSSKSDDDDDNDEENTNCRNEQRRSSKQNSASHKGSNGSKY